MAHITSTPLTRDTRHAFQLLVQWGAEDYVPVAQVLPLLTRHLGLFHGLQLLWLGETSPHGAVLERYGADGHRMPPEAAWGLVAPHMLVGLAVGGEDIYWAQVPIRLRVAPCATPSSGCETG
jgi:hypothetical protein